MNVGVGLHPLLGVYVFAIDGLSAFICFGHWRDLVRRPPVGSRRSHLRTPFLKPVHLRRTGVPCSHEATAPAKGSLSHSSLRSARQFDTQNRVSRNADVCLGSGHANNIISITQPNNLVRTFLVSSRCCSYHSRIKWDFTKVCKSNRLAPLHYRSMQPTILRKIDVEVQVLSP